MALNLEGYIVNVPSSAINQAESSIQPSLHWKNPTPLSPHEVWVGFGFGFGLHPAAQVPGYFTKLDRE